MRTIRKNPPRWQKVEQDKQEKNNRFTEQVIERTRTTATHFVPASMLVLEVKKRIRFAGEDREYTDFVCVNSPGEAFALRGRQHGQGIVTKVVRTVW